MFKFIILYQRYLLILFVILVPNLFWLYFNFRKSIYFNNQYEKLEQSLSNQQWITSDEITFDIVLKIVNQEQELNQQDFQKIPCQDLKKLDFLWLKYSQNRFGFSPQHQIWQSMNNEISREIDKKIAKKIGWLDSNNNLYNYYNQSRNFNLQAPLGHLPFMLYCCLNWDAHKNLWFVEDRIVLSALAQRYDQCLE
jgi:hypothetical protein